MNNGLLLISDLVSCLTPVGQSFLNDGNMVGRIMSNYPPQYEF